MRNSKTTHHPFFSDQEEFFFEESVHVFDNLNICHLPRNALNVSRFGLLHQRSHKHLSLLHRYLKIIAMDSSPSMTKENVYFEGNLRQQTTLSQYVHISGTINFLALRPGGLVADQSEVAINKSASSKQKQTAALMDL